MARAAVKVSTSFGTVNQSAKTQSITMTAYVTSNSVADYAEDLWNYWGYSSNPTSNGTYVTGKSGNPPGTKWGDKVVTTITCDTTFYWRPYGIWYDEFDTINYQGYGSGGTTAHLSWAVDPTVGTPSLSSETSSSVTVDGSWTPATNETTVSLTVQYKKTSDGTWTTWGSTSDTGTGYVSLSIDQTTITGLDAETSYDFRFYVNRSGTSNSTTTYYGSTATTSTLADTPSVTTLASTSITNNSATMRATVDHNTVDGNLSWRYHTADPGTPDDTTGTEASYDSNPVTADGTYTKGISSLTASTTYYYWAIYEDAATSDKYYGSILSFDTLGDPAEEAADEDLMITQYVDGQYGVATTVYFTLRQPAATSSDSFYTGGAPLQADVKITKDGTYDDTSDNAPAQVDAVNSPQLYSLQLSATEMQADLVDVMIVDAAGAAFRDHHIQVRTQQNLGTIVVNAAQKGTNTDAVTYTGNGTGAGLNCVAGDGDGVGIRGVLGDHVQNYGTVAAYNSSTSVDLDNSTAAATNDYYNGAIILFHTGTGAGQARVITDYDGGSYAATLNKALATAVNTATEYIIIPGSDWNNISPGAELGALPTYASSFADFIQFMFQRFVYKRTQTATVFKMFEDDGTTEFASGTVSDDGTTQTHGELGDL